MSARACAQRVPRPGHVQRRLLRAQQLQPGGYRDHEHRHQHGMSVARCSGSVCHRANPPVAQSVYQALTPASVPTFIRVVVANSCVAMRWRSACSLRARAEWQHPARNGRQPSRCTIRARTTTRLATPPLPARTRDACRTAALQWMVVDYKLYDSSQASLAPGTVWIMSQVRAVASGARGCLQKRGACLDLRPRCRSRAPRPARTSLPL